MGRASKRKSQKRNNSNFSSGENQRDSSNFSGGENHSVNLFEFANFLYKRTKAKGFLFICKGVSPIYSDVTESDIDRAFLDSYDPESEVILSCPFIDDDTARKMIARNDWDFPCTTAIFKKGDEETLMRLSLFKPLESFTDEELLHYLSLRQNKRVLV